MKMAAGLLVSRGISRQLLSPVLMRPVCSTRPILVTTPSILSRDQSTSTSVTKGTSGKHWFSERIVSVGLMGLIPVGLIYPTPIIDYSIAVLLPLHIHWGIHSVIVDYIPQPLQMLMKLFVLALSLSTVGGLVYLTYNDIGLCNAVRMLWAIK